MEENKGAKLFTGFLLGTVVGGSAVFLLGTKKGRKVLKMLVEEGKEDMVDLKTLLLARMDELEPEIVDLAPKVSGIEPSTARKVVSSAKKLLKKASKK